jgi:hypothetical protein
MIEYLQKVRDESYLYPVDIFAHSAEKIGGFKMETIYWFLSAILIVVLLLVVSYIWTKENLPKMAENDQWFTTVKKGRIKAVKMSGKIVGYYGNLSDDGLYVDKYTGEIKVGNDPELGKSSLWKEFGAIWLDFGGTVYSYPFEKMDMVNGKIERITPTASSIFLKNRFIVIVDDAETSEMIPITLVAQLIVKTTHAGRALNYDNWISVIESQVKSACRDYIAGLGLREVTKEKLESGGKLFATVKSLNGGSVGNPSLDAQIGQEIVGFSVIDLSISDESVKKAVQSKEIADEEIKGKEAHLTFDQDRIEKLAEAEYQADLKKAKGIVAIGTANNDVLEKTAKIITKKGAERLEKTRLLATGIEKFSGKAFSFGSGSVPFIIGDDNESGKEGKKEKIKMEEK